MANKTNNSPKYGATNEHLSAVYAGLDIQPEDRVLAICGSGDVPFTLLEGINPNSSGIIRAVDLLDVQVKYAKHHADDLARGNINGFMHCEELGEEGYIAQALKKARLVKKVDQRFLDDHGLSADSVAKFLSLSKEGQRDLLKSFSDCNNESFNQRAEMRNDYFSESGRLERIRERLSKLELAKEDIFHNDGQQFDKIYLSNVMGYLVGRRVNADLTAPLVEGVLNRISPRLKQGGLIYYSFGEFPLELPNPSSGWNLEESLCEKAKTISARSPVGDFDWTPVVLKKTKSTN